MLVRRHVGVPILAGLLAIIPLLVKSHYYLSLLILIGLHTIIAVGLFFIAGLVLLGRVGAGGPTAPPRLSAAA